MNAYTGNVSGQITAGHASYTSSKTKCKTGSETPMAHGNKKETMNNNEYYELIDQNYDWDCDPQAEIVQALIAVLERAKADEQQWKGPSWNDGNQVRPLLD